jgi:hypothetical protein
MEERVASDTTADFQWTTQCYISEEATFRENRNQNLKFRSSKPISFRDQSKVSGSHLIIERVHNSEAVTEYSI